MIVNNVQVYDLEESIRASKYPMAVDTENCNSDITSRVKSLAQCKKGTGHDQFLTGIRVNFDLTFSNKAWVEAERYRFLEFVSSQSTMHRITQLDIEEQCNEYVWEGTKDFLKIKVEEYNRLLEYRKSLTEEDKAYFKSVDNVLAEMYLTILYNVPSGFNLTARLTTNYRALKTIYSQRRNHRLPEWREFCRWIETLPYAKELITGECDE